MKQDFIESNTVKKHVNIEKKKKEFEDKMKETYKYFPFTGSEEVEKRRHDLKVTQRKEFQQYVNSNSAHTFGHKKELSTDQNFHKTAFGAISPLNHEFTGNALHSVTED